MALQHRQSLMCFACCTHPHIFKRVKWPVAGCCLWCPCSSSPMPYVWLWVVRKILQKANLQSALWRFRVHQYCVQCIAQTIQTRPSARLAGETKPTLLWVELPAMLVQNDTQDTQHRSSGSLSWCISLLRLGQSKTYILVLITLAKPYSMKAWFRCQWKKNIQHGKQQQLKKKKVGRKASRICNQLVRPCPWSGDTATLPAPKNTLCIFNGL